jgi:transcriptional regulator with XRE-family HTH domain
MTVLGRNIARLRTEKGWTQTLLARKADIAAPYLNQIEHGVRNGRWEVHIAIARAVGVTLRELTQPQNLDMVEAEAEALCDYNEAIADLKTTTEKAVRKADDPTLVYKDHTERIRDIIRDIMR